MILTTLDGYAVQVEAADAHLAERQWLTYPTGSGKRFVRQVVLDAFGRATLGPSLRRHVAGYSTAQGIFHANGDPLDCRRSNLRVGRRRRPLPPRLSSRDRLHRPL